MFKPAKADAAAASKLRPDLKRLQTLYGDRRSADRLIAHYQLERRLADRLRHATPTEQGTLYGQLYSELYAVITDHPQHTAARNADSRRVNDQIELIARHIGHTTIFVEIGCGDAAHQHDPQPVLPIVRTGPVLLPSPDDGIQIEQPVASETGGR
jgi:hypothetical protein